MNELSEHGRLAQLARTCACMNLRRATRAITNYYDDLLLAACGLRATQITQLVVLYLGGTQTINEIAGKLGLDRTTLTRNLKPLEEAGLIKIETGDDQRTRRVTLTNHGKDMLLKALPVWEEAQTHVVQGIGEEKFGNLLTQLSRISTLAQKG